LNNCQTGIKMPDVSVGDTYVEGSGQRWGDRRGSQGNQSRNRITCITHDRYTGKHTYHGVGGKGDKKAKHNVSFLLLLS
jgi:hypothetical protein